MKSGITTAGESHKFARDIVWFSAAQLFVSLIFGMITLPALAKSYASEIYGIWVQVTVTVELISPLLSLQLGLATVRFLAAEEDRARRRRAVGAMLTSILVFSCVVSVAGLLLSRQLSTFLFGSPGYVNFVNFLIIWTFFNSLFNFLLGYLRARGKIRDISIIQVVITVLKMAAMVGMARAGASFESIIAVMVTIQVLSAIYVLVAITRDIGFPIPNLSGLRGFLAFSVPQMPVITALWVTSLSDRYFVTHYLGLSQNGIYSSSATIATLTSLFYMPVSFVLLALVSRLWEEKRREDVKRYLDYSMKFFLTLAIPGAIGITMVSQPLLRLLTTSEFLAGPEIVLLVAFGSVFLGVFHINSNVILLDRHSRMLPLMAASGAATSIAINFILVPRIGIIGAAVSNCAAYFVAAVITTIWARKTVKYDFGLGYLWKVGAAAAAMALSLAFLKISSGPGIVLAVIAGSAVFGGGLLALRAFSPCDMMLMKTMLKGVLSRRQREQYAGE